MKELTNHKFSDLYEMKSGISSKPEQAGHGAPFCSFSTVFNNYFLPPELPDQMDTSIEEQRAYSLQKGDILLTRTSETLDELGMSCVAAKDYPRATYSGFLKRLRPVQKNISYHKFMAFYLRSPLFRKTMNNNAVMTLRCSLNEEIFSYLNLLLPDFDQQIKIGEFLYQINQKIELNIQISKALEGMAKLLYDYWFVQFDFPISREQASTMGNPCLEGKPYRSSFGQMVFNDIIKRKVPKLPGWREEDVMSSCKIVDCLHSRKPDFCKTPDDKFLLQLENIQDDGLINLSSKHFVSLADYQNWTSRIEVTDGDLLVTNAGRIAANAQVPKGLTTGIGRNITAIRPRSISPTFLFHSFRGEDVRRQIIWNTDSGAFFKSLNVKGIKKLKILRPDASLESKFEELVLPLRRRREISQQQNQQLSELRNWLLPMLMNGQVTVS